MRLPRDAHDGQLPLERVLRVLIEHGVEIRKEGHRHRLKKDDVLEWQYMCDPTPRWIIQDLSRKYDIDMVEFYFFGNTENNHREPDGGPRGGSDT
jgi:hypothetical protein